LRVRSGAVTPAVGIAIVNRDRRELLLRCLDSLAALDWPKEALEVVVVDNASSDGSAEAVRQRHPEVRVVEEDRNLGFAGGANRAVGELQHVDYVALLNNDTVVAPDWLRPLVEALDSDPGLGGAAPKVLFDPQFREVRLDAQATRRSRADPRPVALRVSGVRVDGLDEWRRTQFVTGWHREELGHDGSFRWSSGPALLRVPDGQKVELRIGTKPAWQDVSTDGPPLDVVNNAGSSLVEGGYGADRGFQEVDAGQYNEPKEVFAWSGSSVLLRQAYLKDVGRFDERLFLYYEDFDLSWRGRARGWRYLYVPSSLVRHVHTASTIEGSERFDYYVERNRLLVHAKNAPGGYAARVALKALWMLVVIARREVVRRALFRGRPDFMLVRRRARAFAGFVALLPPVLVDRLRLRRRQQMPYKEQLKWLVALSDLERHR
jgi:GT2 family glycosyltransferase